MFLHADSEDSDQTGRERSKGDRTFKSVPGYMESPIPDEPEFFSDMQIVRLYSV